MRFRRHPQDFHGQVLECQQRLGFIRQQKVDIRPGEFDYDLRILEIRMGMRAGGDLERHLETREIDDSRQKVFDLWSGRRKAEFRVAQAFPTWIPSSLAPVSRALAPPARAA